jgi:hypothetical protein
MKFSQTFLGKRCPPLLLACGRLLLRASERRRLIREYHIRKSQDALIQEQYDRQGADLVVYIVDGADWITGKEKISGGLLSIASMFEEAKKLPELSSHQVMMAVLDSCPLILRHTEFENNITVFRLSQVFSYFGHLRHLIINVPELLVPALPAELRKVRPERLKAIQSLHVNIVNQNNQKMPGPEAVETLKGVVPRVTMTIGHARACTVEMSRRYGITLHYLSTRCSPEYYRRRGFAEKTDLLTVSNDERPMKAAILEELQAKLPALRIEVIRNLAYSQYKAMIEKAKWGVTFGEGLDWYFLETVFSGGISFAVYNEEFFPAEYKGLPTLFDSYEHMRRDLPAMLKRLDNAESYQECQSALFNFLKKHHRYEEYLQKLRSFYRGDYDIPFQDGR